MTGVLITFNLSSMALLLWIFVQGYHVPLSMPVRSHIVWALMATAFVVFSHSLTMMYMAAVGRMVREAVEKGSLNQQSVVQARTYRKSVFKVAGLAMLVVMGNTILAGGAHTKVFPVWVHDLLAIAALLINMSAVFLEVRYLIAIHLLGHAVAGQYDEKRNA